MIIQIPTLFSVACFQNLSQDFNFEDIKVIIIRSLQEPLVGLLQLAVTFLIIKGFLRDLRINRSFYFAQFAIGADLFNRH